MYGVTVHQDLDEIHGGGNGGDIYGQNVAVKSQGATSMIRIVAVLTFLLAIGFTFYYLFQNESEGDEAITIGGNSSDVGEDGVNATAGGRRLKWS